MSSPCPTLNQTATCSAYHAIRRHHNDRIVHGRARLCSRTMPVPLLSMSYQPSHDIDGPNFQRDLAFGLEGEQIIRDFLDALDGGKFEVKYDRYRNGRMAVETEQNPRNEGWKLSGINVTEADWWVYLFAPGSFIIVEVARLKRYLRTNYSLLTKRTFAAKSDNPAKGFVLMPNQVQDLMTNELYD